MTSERRSVEPPLAKRRLSRGDQWIIALILWGDLALLAMIAAALIWRS